MKTIGRFKVLGLLGKGGMGKVFRVAYPVTGRIAALKLLDPAEVLARTMGMDVLEKAFTREARAMAGIRHGHVVDVLDFGRADAGRLFYVMDFYCNHLGTLMGEAGEAEATRVLTVEKAVRYTCQTLHGLACLHFAGIIHRDIKPANLLITDRDEVKISDFGLSRLRGETMPRHSSIRVGSPFYAAPEQEADPDGVDETADLYSVGVMLHKMLTGHLPTPGTKRPSEVNPDLDGSWDRFIEKAVHPNPGRRFPSAEAMFRAMEDQDRTWQEKKENICALPEVFEEEVSGDDRPRFFGPVRSRPAKIPKKEACQRFCLDHHMRPLAYGGRNFTPLSPDLVLDRSTRLIWQRSGPLFPLDWERAKFYVDRLNTEAFGGRTTWRLPTIPELLSTVSPLPRGRDHCLAPVFDVRQRWLWSADRATFTSAWYLNLEMGFVDRNDFTSFYHVKAVCHDT